MLITFTAVFTAEGAKNGKAWKRWDFKTADGTRYVTFDAGLANQISVNAPGEMGIEGDNRIVSWKPVGSSGVEPSPQNGSEAVRNELVASGGPSVRDTQIHRQTAAKVSAHLLALYPEDEQTTETFFALAERLVDYFQNGLRDPIAF